jgi:hypothetical protein
MEDVLAAATDSDKKPPSIILTSDLAQGEHMREGWNQSKLGTTKKI